MKTKFKFVLIGLAAVVPAGIAIGEAQSNSTNVEPDDIKSCDVAVDSGDSSFEVTADRQSPGDWDLTAKNGCTDTGTATLNETLSSDDCGVYDVVSDDGSLEARAYIACDGEGTWEDVKTGDTGTLKVK